MPRLRSGKVIFTLFFLLTADFCLVPLAHLPVPPVFLYLLIPYAAFRWHWEKTVPLAIAIGLLRDLAGSQPLGAETAALAAVSAGLDFLILKIDRGSFLMQFAACFLFIFLVMALTLILSGFLGSAAGLSWKSLGIALGAALSTAAAMPFFFYLNALWFRERVSLKQYELFG